MSDASCSISCIDDLGETRSCIACDYECMRRNVFENVDFSIGEEGAVGTEYSQSSSDGDKKGGRIDKYQWEWEARPCLLESI